MVNPWNVPGLPHHDMSLLPVKAVRSYTGRSCSGTHTYLGCKGYYVCKGYFDTIPKSLDEAARIDGATRAQIFVKMIIPLSKPMIIYTALTAFMAPWCDYVFASYVAFGNDNGYNVAVAMQRWVWTNDFQGYFTRFCAGGVLVAIPVTVLFLCLQKYYVEGVTGGAVKG